MKKLFVVLIIIVLLIPSAVYAVSEADRGEYYDENGEYWYDIAYCIVNPKSELNVRYKPSKRSGVSYTIGFGDEVRVLSTKNGWSYCIVNGEGDKGYVSAKYLSYFEPVKVDEDMVVVCEGKAIIRESPSKSSKKYKYIKNGSTIHIMYMIGNWAITKNWKFINSECIDYIEKETVEYEY